MDNLTHSLTGLALARAGLSRFSPRATLLLLISANIPDIDIVGLSRGPLCYLEVHRGYSHSLIFLPAMALLSVLVTAAIYRQKLPWLKAWLICVVGVGSHLLLDWTNSYGIRLFLPFSSRWFHLDINSLTDLVILSVLALAALWPLLSRLVAAEIGERSKHPQGRRMAVFALVFFALFDVSRAILHARAVGQLASRLYEEAPPVRAAALPGPVDPFTWRGIVETRNAYSLLNVNTLGDIDPASAQLFYKPPVTPALQAAKATEPFRYFQYFARFPVWSFEPVTESNRQGIGVELTDLRFGTPGRGLFHCTAVVSGRGGVFESRFRF